VHAAGEQLAFKVPVAGAKWTGKWSPLQNFFGGHTRGRQCHPWCLCYQI